MICSATTEIYNDVFTRQYKHFIKFSKGDADNVHNSYLKTVNRLNEMTFTATTETELRDKLKIYTKTVIHNGFKTEKKLQKTYIDVGWEAEDKLTLTNKHHEDERLYHEELEYFTIKLFEYLKKNHTPEDQYVFRVYYLYDKNNKKITYEKLSKITGYSVSKCCGIVQKLKQDLKLNLISYINTNGTT